MSDLNKTMTEKIISFIDTYRKNKDVSIIATFGKYSGVFGFDDKLFQEEIHEKICILLDSCNTWEEIIEETDNVFMDVPHKVLDTFIFTTNGCFDVQFKIVTKKTDRFYVSDNFEQTLTKYKRKNHTYVTIVDKDDLNNKQFRFNLILDTINNESSRYLADSTILKIQDVMNTCIPLEKCLEFTEI